MKLEIGNWKFGVALLLAKRITVRLCSQTEGSRPREPLRYARRKSFRIGLRLVRTLALRLIIGCSKHRGYYKFPISNFQFLLPFIFLQMLPAFGAPPPVVSLSKPNIIYIMCDDMGYGQLGCYGQPRIKTPRIDRMAKEGLLLTDYYAGTSVCAPSRCALMTGRHVGHTYIRGNKEYSDGQEPIPDETITVAEKMKEAGYATAVIGKWGLGYPGSEGEPNKQGFDLFYGYNDQKHAHHHLTNWLYRNDQQEFIGEGDNPNAKGYSHYFLTKEARKFIKENKDNPFFLYLAYVIPHARMEIPDTDESYLQYINEDWPQKQKILAGMISLMDKDVGIIMDDLKELGIAENTLVVFTSDNGPHKEGGVKPDFFDDNGPLRGIKRDMYEGGVRVPFIAWWPGTIEAGRRSDHLGAHWDLMATACEMGGVQLPPDTDSISYLPLLKGDLANQKQHDSLYFELVWPTKRGIRVGDWICLQKSTTALDPDVDATELYNIKEDLEQRNNLASKMPEKLMEMKALLKAEHAPSKLFEFGSVKTKMIQH